MQLEVGKTYRRKGKDTKIIMLGRLDTLSKNGCLIGEDITYGVLIPIIDENPDNWTEEYPPDYIGGEV